MKPIRLIHRISAAALALLMLASLPACKEQPTTPAESDNDTTQQVTDTPEATTPSDETNAPVDPSEPDVTLTADTAVIVVSDYAATWEKTAAEELAAELGLSVVSDTAIPEGKTCLAIGYTALNEHFSADFDTWGDLGYTVDAVDGHALVAANSEEGMASALASFREAMTSEKVLAAVTHILVKASSKDGVNTLYRGDWGDNVAHAASLTNTVGTHYRDIRRTLWKVYNSNVTLHYDMKKEHCLTSIENEYGIPYAYNTGTVYIVDAQGKR